ncbi:MFS transporter [Klenkia sp. LSe6-5]|uniref:MFS transporter n=1 Tax=Klenkia sesuvii TaxID=3103137 RepID=A0ABU8DRZ8_9ACTN
MARRLLRRPDFRRLLLTRLASQFGDGMFQAALAGTVLFNPQRAADPVDVAAGFAVLLVPYSLLGPFVGVWLDRWSRRQVLLVANAVRALLVAGVAALVVAGVGGPAFYLAGLAVFSVNRFVLSALSAGLPHTCDRPSLVSANALSTTAGAVSTVLGGGVAIGVQSLLARGDSGYAVLALCAAGPYLLGSAIVAGFARDHLGPDHTSRAATTSARDVLHGMLAGARHVLDSRPATWVLTLMAVHRICFGVLTLLTLLLYRTTLEPVGLFFPVGLPGIAQVLGAGAVGTLLAAVLTPPAVRRWGKGRWTTGVLLLGGAGQLGLGLPFLAPTIVAAGFLLGFVAQAVKICVDSTLQEVVHDDFRGRVFSVYDAVFNVTFVLALVLGALTLPASGASVPALVLVGVLYVAAAAGNAARGTFAPSPALR